MAVAPVRVIVPQHVMLSAAVVPECHRIRLPLEAHAELGGLYLSIKHFENRITFTLSQTNNMRGEEAIHEQAFPTSFGMRADNRMLGARVSLAAIVIAVTTPIVLLAVVDCAQAVNQLSDWFRKHLVGKIHVGEHGIAAAVGWQFGKMQYGAHGWFGIA